MPVNTFQLLAAVGACVLGAFFNAPAHAANHADSPKSANTVPVWQIKQTSYNLGDIDITLAKDGMRWHNSKLGITLLVHGPDWKLNAFNESNKKYVVLTKEEALEMFQHQRRSKHAPMETPIPMGDAPPIAGAKTVRYCYPRDVGHVTEQFALSVTNAVDKGAKLTTEQKNYIERARAHQRREYFLARDIPISPQVSGFFFENRASTKYSENMPLRMIQMAHDGSKTMMFDTKQVKKSVASKDIFNLPAGLTRADNKIALLVNDKDFGDDDSDEPMLAKEARKNEPVHR